MRHPSPSLLPRVRRFISPAFEKVSCSVFLFFLSGVFGLFVKHAIPLGHEQVPSIRLHRFWLSAEQFVQSTLQASHRGDGADDDPDWDHGFPRRHVAFVPSVPFVLTSTGVLLRSPGLNKHRKGELKRTCTSLPHVVACFSDRETASPLVARTHPLQYTSALVLPEEIPSPSGPHVDT